MTGESRYLEKYSVAPAPSRDYYGIRILHNEVKLFLWKISHGPHRIPIVRSTSFADFERDASLHEEILRVFGKSVLQYVRDTIAGKTKNSEENSCGLTKGWNRVFKEGQLMQQAGKSASFEKKRCVRPKGRISPTRVKGRAPSKVRAKIVSKTPLEVIKKISGPKPSADKSPEKSKAARIHNHKTPATARQITEVSEKILSMTVTKIVDEPKTGREAHSDARIMTTSSTINNTREKVKLTTTGSKSTILKTGERLIKGLSTVENKNVEIADLIQQEAKKNHVRSSSVFDSYFSCLEDIEKSTESSPEKYRIENPWSSNSSIVSVDTPKNDTRNTKTTQNDRSSITNKIKTARQSLTNRSSVKANKEETHDQRAKSVQTKPETSASIGTSTSRTLNTIKRSATSANRVGNIGSSSSRNLNVGRTISGSTKNQSVSTKNVSESKLKINEK